MIVIILDLTDFLSCHAEPPFLLSPAPAPMLSAKAEMGARRDDGQESRRAKYPWLGAVATAGLSDK